MDTNPGTAPHRSNVLLFAVATLAVCLAAAALVPVMGARLERGWQVVLESVVITALLVPLVARLFRVSAPAAKPPAAAGDPAGVDWPVSDPRTGAFSRRGITVALLEYMALAERYHRPVSVALVGLEDTGTIESRLGTAGRDAVFDSVAASIAEILRMPDRVGTLGDGTFLVVLPETGAQDAQVLAERLRAVVGQEEVPVAPTQRLQIRVSIGVTELRPGEDLEQLMARAGQALAAGRGSGTVHVLRSRAA